MELVAFAQEASDKLIPLFAIGKIEGSGFLGDNFTNGRMLGFRRAHLLELVVDKRLR